jgi:hypothetical protein
MRRPFATLLHAGAMVGIMGVIGGSILGWGTGVMVTNLVITGLFAVLYCGLEDTEPDTDSVSDTQNLSDEDPLDPVDKCGHNAPAVPIDIDSDADGTYDTIIGWLCSECGAKVSAMEAVRRGLPDSGNYSQHDPWHITTIRAALDQARNRVTAETSTWTDGDGGQFVLAFAQAEKYKTLVAEADRIKAILDEAEARSNRMKAAGVKCKGYREVPGHAPGSVVRQYAVPGECLCGNCEVPPPPEGPILAPGAKPVYSRLHNGRESDPAD